MWFHPVLLNQISFHAGHSELVTNDPAAGPGPLGIIPKGAIIIQDGHLAWVGPASSAPAADTTVDVQGRAVLPGWVDSNTRPGRRPT